MTRANSLESRIDPAIRAIDLYESTLTYDIWDQKYRWNDEPDFEATALRVCKGIYQFDHESHMEAAFDAMRNFLWMPAGRILAGAGTNKRVTLMNCYVTGTIEDSMEGIMKEHTNFALTMQQGGGDGADFSTIRPEGAILKRTGTKASGPMPFMDMWNSMCTTIRSAGDRRGAMMGVMCDTHPDLPKFIVAKREKGRLTNFNVSVLVSDAFMEAVKEDEDWMLHFGVPPASTRALNLVELDFVDDDGNIQFVYSVWKARDLWKLITENTYEYSEPGVIFIDRINELNNLNYCETIRCTNPCGEQPLPPHGTCNLGHVNLSRMVMKPFSADARFDFDLLQYVTALGVRFLDNVIDVTNYPLPEQQAEELAKRRIGLGFTGLADVFAMMGLRYGGPRSADLAEKIMQTICLESYKASVMLASERGSFPLFDAEKYLSGTSFAANVLPDNLKDLIKSHGIRNGVLNTIAPTGTSSIAYGNPSGGLEPTFAHFTQRNVLQADGSWRPYKEYGFAARVYRKLFNQGDVFPSHMVTTDDLSIHDHLLIQNRVQRWTDASISKTLNVPKEMPYDEFVKVYDLAYGAGCKGATTYRPSDVRGAVLQKASGDDSSAVTEPETHRAGTELGTLRVRPDVLTGCTYKIKWPNRESALYLTINSDEQGVPFEIFITSKDGSYSEWTTALSLMITAICRMGGDIRFVPNELKQIQSLRDGAWINQRYVGSLPAQIGILIEQHLAKAETKQTKPFELPTTPTSATPTTAELGETCPKCFSPSLFKVEGCKKCLACGFSECN